MDQSYGHQNGIDRAIRREHGKKQHGKRGSHDQIRQIDNHLEKLRAADFQAGVYKPGNQEASRSAITI